MLALLDPRSWVAAGLAALCLLLGATAGVQMLRLSSAHAALAAEKLARADEHAAAEKAARKAVEAARLVEAKHAADQERIADAYQADLKRQADARARADADADSLRLAVACYAAGDCVGAAARADPGVDWKRRAATLGRLFRAADAEAGRLAAAADQHAGEERALKELLLVDRAACGPDAFGADNAGSSHAATGR